MFTEILNFILDSAVTLLTSVLNILPQSPFSLISNSPIQEFLPTLNWFVPVSQIVSILQLWVTAVLTFYGYKLILRWVKAI